MPALLWPRPSRRPCRRSAPTPRSRSDIRSARRRESGCRMSPRMGDSWTIADEPQSDRRAYCCTRWNSARLGRSARRHPIARRAWPIPSRSRAATMAAWARSAATRSASGSCRPTYQRRFCSLPHGSVTCRPSNRHSSHCRLTWRAPRHDAQEADAARGGWHLIRAWDRSGRGLVVGRHDGIILMPYLILRGLHPPGLRDRQRARQPTRA